MVGLKDVSRSLQPIEWNTLKVALRRLNTPRRPGKASQSLQVPLNGYLLFSEQMQLGNKAKKQESVHIGALLMRGPYPFQG